MELMYERIISLRTHDSNNHSTGTSVLKTTAIITNSLEQIHDQFVVTPIDKATGNVAFICKHFYIEALGEDFGIDLDGVSNNIFMTVNH